MSVMPSLRKESNVFRTLLGIVRELQVDNLALIFVYADRLYGAGSVFVRDFGSLPRDVIARRVEKAYDLDTTHAYKSLKGCRKAKQTPS